MPDPKQLQTSKSSEPRANIIAQVGTTLRFFALSVLVVEVILAMMASSASGTDKTYLIVGMIGTLVLMIVSVVILELLRPGLLDDGARALPPSVIRSTDPEGRPSLTFQDNDDPDFSRLFEHYLQKANRIHLVGTGFSILRRERFRELLTERLEGNCNLEIFAANPFSPNVQTRLIEEEVGEPAPMIRQAGLIDWLRDLLRIRDGLANPCDFSLKLFPFYPTYALFVFDEQEYFFYPYGYAQLGTLSPVLHFSKQTREHAPMVEFLDKQYRFISECSSDAGVVFSIHDEARVDAKDLTAFAVYLIPPAESRLYQFGSQVLGYDVREREAMQRNSWDSSIGAAGDFGFHLTVADALYCTHPKDVDLICSEVEFVAQRSQPFTLEFKLQNGFPTAQGIALVCCDESGALESLHHEIVSRVYRKAVASNYSRSLGKIARADRDHYTQRAEYMIRHYHAPYILNSYRPHFSLLSAVPPDKKEQVSADIEGLLKESAVEEAVRIRDIAVMHRPDPGGRWRILKEFKLGGGQQ